MQNHFPWVLVSSTLVHFLNKPIPRKKSKAKVIHSWHHRSLDFCCEFRTMGRCDLTFSMADSRNFADFWRSRGVGCYYCNCVPLFVSKCSGAPVRLLPASGYNLRCTAEALIILMLCLCTVFDWSVSLTTATTLTTVMYGKYMAQSVVQWLDYQKNIIIIFKYCSTCIWLGLYCFQCYVKWIAK